MKFAIWLLVILAVVSLLSMFIVEFYPIDTNFPGWEEMYAERYGAAFPLMKFLHLQDPYRSFWYQFILGALALSLTICVIDRLPENIKLALGKRSAFTREQLKQYANTASFKTGKDFTAKLKNVLKGYSFGQSEKDGVTYISADHSRVCYLGPVFMHIGLLLLVLGGFWSIWGISTYGSGFAGDIITPDDFTFQVRVDDFHIVYYPLGVGQWALADGNRFGKIVKRLPQDRFKVEFRGHGEEFSEDIEASRLQNQFNIEADRGNIKDYISDLTVLENGKEIFQKKIEVNSPMRYKGMRFYQSSFDPRNPRVNATLDSALVQITSAQNGKVDYTQAVVLGQKYPLPDGTEFSASDFLPHFVIGDEGPSSASSNMSNPAVKITVFKDGAEAYHQWIFLFHDFHGMQKEAAFNFKLADYYNPQAQLQMRTVIEIKGNQGYWVIWLGIIFASIGVFLSFYFNPKHFKITAETAGEGYNVIMGGTSYREKIRFTEEFKRIIEKIK